MSSNFRVRNTVRDILFSDLAIWTSAFQCAMRGPPEREGPESNAERYSPYGR